MKRTIGLILAFFVMACGFLYGVNKNRTLQVDKASAPVVVTDKLDEIQAEFDVVQKDRGLKDSWAAEVFPGDERDSSQIEQSLVAAKAIKKDLENLPVTDKSTDLKQRVHLFMAHEATNLLVVARRDQDLRALEVFLRFASIIDTSPDTFGVSPDQLRNEALVMARKEVAILRPRLREGSGDAQVYLQHIIRAWRFTPSQLGLTKEDMKEVADK